MKRHTAQRKKNSKKTAKSNLPVKLYGYTLVGVGVVLLVFLSQAMYVTVRNTYVLGDAIQSGTNEQQYPQQSYGNNPPVPPHVSGSPFQQKNMPPFPLNGTPPLSRPGWDQMGSVSGNREVHFYQPPPPNGENHTMPEGMRILPQELQASLSGSMPWGQQKTHPHDSSLPVHMPTGAQIQLGNQNNSLSVKEIQSDGSQTELDGANVLSQLNSLLSENGIHIGTTEAVGGFEIKKGNITAQTQLPIGVDPSSKQITVSTPGGTKVLSVLPDQALNSLLTQHIFSTLDEGITAAANSTTSAISLTQLNNEPMFSINGKKSKHLFGIFPVNIAKTAFVSAQTGQLVKTDESFSNKLMDSLSF